LTDIPDVVKINCEGAEYAIIDDLDRSGWLGNIPEIFIQHHKIKDWEELYKTMAEKLSKTHKLTNQIKTWQLWKLV